MKSADDQSYTLETLIACYRDVFEYLKSVFQYEEESVFPCILSECPTPELTSVISELRAEHIMILKGIEEFLKISPKDVIYLYGNRSVRLEELGRQMAAILSEHVEKESEKVLPLLRKYAATS